MKTNRTAKKVAVHCVLHKDLSVHVGWERQVYLDYRHRGLESVKNIKFSKHRQAVKTGPYSHNTGTL